MIKAQEREALLFANAKTNEVDRLAKQLWANLWDVAKDRTPDSITINKESLRQGLLKMRNREV